MEKEKMFEKINDYLKRIGNEKDYEELSEIKDNNVNI